MSWIRRLLDWIAALFKKDDEPAPPTPQPQPEPEEPPVPEPEEPVEPTDEEPDKEQPDADEEDTRPQHVRTWVNGEKIEIKYTDTGLIVADKVYIEGAGPLEIKVEIDPLEEGSPEYEALVTEEGFRDGIHMPGTALLRLDSWPYNDPMYIIAKLDIKGTTPDGEPGGWNNTTQENDSQKAVYLANITLDVCTFTIKTKLTENEDVKSTDYGLVKGQVSPKTGDDRIQRFEIWREGDDPSPEV